MSDDHVFSINIFVMLACVVHRTLDEFDECNRSIARVSAWAHLPLAVPGHGVTTLASTASTLVGNGHFLLNDLL